MAITHPMPTNEGVPLPSDLEAHSSDSNITQGDLFGNEVDEENLPIDARWYARVAPFIDRANRISQKLCKFPGFCVSVDEMMRLFKG